MQRIINLLNSNFFQEETDGLDYMIFRAYFALSVAQFILSCFAETVPETAEKVRIYHFIPQKITEKKLPRLFGVVFSYRSEIQYILDRFIYV